MRPSPGSAVLLQQQLALAQNVRTLMVVILLCAAAGAVRAQNITQIMAAYPRYSTFARLLSGTGVINEVESRKSLTLLVPPNAVLDPMVAPGSGNFTTASQVADVIRYHVLLQYLDLPELQHITNNSVLVTTLYQTTGRAAALDGFVNVTDAANGAVLVGPPTPGAPMQAAILTNITQFPYNYSLYEINGVLVPVGLASTSASPAAAPSIVVAAPAPVPAASARAPAPVPFLAPTAATPILSPAPATATPTPSPSTAAAPASSPVVTAPAATSAVPTPVPSVAASPPAPPNSGPAAAAGASPAEAPAASQSSTPARPSGAPASFLRPTATFALMILLSLLLLGL